MIWNRLLFEFNVVVVLLYCFDTYWYISSFVTNTNFTHVNENENNVWIQYDSLSWIHIYTESSRMNSILFTFCSNDCTISSFHFHISVDTTFLMNIASGSLLPIIFSITYLYLDGSESWNEKVWLRSSKDTGVPFSFIPTMYISMSFSAVDSPWTQSSAYGIDDVYRRKNSHLIFVFFL